jgi:hypothetical protein
MKRRSALEATRPLAVAFLAVQSLRLGRRARNFVTLAKPLKQVAILAPAAAKWRMFRGRWLAA